MDCTFVMKRSFFAHVISCMLFLNYAVCWSIIDSPWVLVPGPGSTARTAGRVWERPHCQLLIQVSIGLSVLQPSSVTPNWIQANKGAPNNV